MRNWREYEAELRKRGDLTLWFSEEAIAAWRAPTSERPGGQPVYSDLAIEAALTVRLVYGLALRQTEGFLKSISTLLDLGLRIPDHTTLSRRSKDLNVRIPVSANDGSLHIMIDSTGLRVHCGNIPGSSPPKCRAWRKLHKDAQTQIGPNASSQRNATVRAIAATGRRQWAHDSGYTRRSLVETAMWRYKEIIGGSMRSRTMPSQNTEAALACAILNRMTQLGTPDGCCIA